MEVMVNLSEINNTFSFDMATDRDQWRRIEEAAKYLNGRDVLGRKSGITPGTE